MNADPSHRRRISTLPLRLRPTLAVALAAALSVLTRCASAAADGVPVAFATVPVHIEVADGDDTPVVLDRVSSSEHMSLSLSDGTTGQATSIHTFTVCVAPCDARIEVNAAYRVDGAGMPPSSTFALPRDGDVRIDVARGSTLERLGGGTLMTLGLLTAGAAAAVLAAPQILVGDGGALPSTTAVAAVLGAGVLAAIGGLVLVVDGTTRVHVESRALAKAVAR